MSTYSLQLKLTVGSYEKVPMVMIDVTITADTSRFYEGALPFEATARNGATAVHSFMAVLSPNGKELHAFFTTDAFGVFPGGTFDLDFGNLGRVRGTIENVNISILSPLPPIYAGLGLPNADNAWLASLG